MYFLATAVVPNSENVEDIWKELEDLDVKYSIKEEDTDDDDETTGGHYSDAFIGARWNGWIHNNRKRIEVFEDSGMTDEENLKNNLIPVKNVSPGFWEYLPQVLITPEKWYDREEGDGMEDEEWEKIFFETLKNYPEHVLVALCCHT